MTNAITINGTNETITSLTTGFGADLRGVIVVRDEAVMRKHPGKPLCRQASSAASYWQPSAQAAAAAARGRSERPGDRVRRMMPEAQVRLLPAFPAVADLPAAAWATLVLARALSV